MWGAGHTWLGPGEPFFVLFGVGLLVLGLWLISGGAWTWNHGHANRAIEILDERYAAGEISTVEYRERRTHLE